MFLVCCIEQRKERLVVRNVDLQIRHTAITARRGAL
jgi:hypothetical protein